MNTKLYVLFPLTLILLVLAACSANNPTPNPNTPSASTPPPTDVGADSKPAPTTTASAIANPGRPVATPRAASSTPTIALLMASIADDRARQIKDAFMQAAASATTTVTSADAGGDAAKQKTQVAEALGQGAQVLVIQPVDQDKAASFVDAAHKAGASVIALDRLINTRDLDAYVSFDNFGIGQAQANEAVRWLTAGKAKTPWNFVLLEGPAGDSVAAEITRGYYDVLKSLIDKKQVVVTLDKAHSEGSTAQGAQTVSDALTKTSNNIAAVLANNSALGRGAIQTLDAQKLTGKVFVSSADADMPSIAALCGGQQNQILVADSKVLATAAAKLANAVAGGKSVPETSLAGATLLVADRQVPLASIPVRAVTLDTAQVGLVQSGLYLPSQIGKCSPSLADGAAPPRVNASGKLVLWAQEGGDLYNYIANLAGQFVDANPGVQIEVVNLDAASLRDKWKGKAADLPDMVWAPGDVATSLLSSNRVQTVDGAIDVSPFVTATTGVMLVGGKQYGVPVQSANYLLLYYNKKLLKEAPADTTALARLATTLTKTDGSQWTLTYNTADPGYLIPWFTAYNGKALSDDGRTALLNTAPMTDTLTLLKQWRDQKVAQPDADAGGADNLFKGGKAALVINGDWAYADYAAALGDNLGVARLPKVTKTGEYPHSFSTGHYLLWSTNATGDKLTLAQAFTQYITSRAIQLDMAKRWKRLPALRDALTDGVIVNDAFLKASADQVSVNLPLPPEKALLCVLDAIRPNVAPVVGGKTSTADAAKAMQTAADACMTRQ